MIICSLLGLYNTSPRSSVETIDTVIGNEIKLRTFDDHQLRLDDELELIDKSTNQVVLEGKVDNINSSKVVTFNSTTTVNNLDQTKKWDIRRKVIFGKFLSGNTDHLDSNVESLVSGVQNTYDSDSQILVTSESIPNYEIALKRNKEILILRYFE